MFRLKRSVKGYKPLLCLTNRLLLSKSNKLYISDINLEKIDYICTVPNGFWWSRFVRVRILERVLRGGILSAIELNAGNVLLVTRGRIWRLHLDSMSLAVDFDMPNGRNALSLTKISNIDGLEDCICFGEYFNNNDMDEVNIWTRPMTQEGVWSIASTFDKGEINHVHNISIDKKNKKVYILTGDFAQGACLWEAKEKFNLIEPILRGSQLYRATWLWGDPSGKVVYATDSQLERNSLNFLERNEGSCEVSEISGIQGSSIYAGSNANYVAFSTAVEPGAPSGSLIKDVFEKKIGSGILSDSACIYTYSLAEGIEEIFKGKKDFYPLRLGQFGTFTFPSGEFPEGYIYAYGIALKGLDDRCLIFKEMNKGRNK